MTLPVIDIHPHVIAPDEARYPRAPIGGEASPWSQSRPVSAPGMVAAIDGAGISKSVLVQASTCYGHDNSYVTDSVAAYPQRFAGVFSVDVLAPDAPRPALGATVHSALDWERRYSHMRMHTAMHVMSSLIKGNVTGGQVGADKSRLDFNLEGEVPSKEWVTEEINKLIALDRPVTPQWITDEELAARPELVKTMSVRPPVGAGRVRLLSIEGIDLQACGGTHVAHTGEIGRVECTKIENKGKMNRRFIIALA